MLLVTCTEDISGAASALFFASSSDGINWTIGNEIAPQQNGWDYNPYRGSLVQDDGNGLSWVYYSGQDASGHWHMGRVPAVLDSVESRVLTAINADSTQQTLQTNVATASAQATLAAQLGASDRILEDVSGVQKLKTYEKGTPNELIPAKTAKQPGGATLTDPSIQRLAGYRE